MAKHELQTSTPRSGAASWRAAIALAIIIMPIAAHADDKVSGFEGVLLYLRELFTNLVNQVFGASLAENLKTQGLSMSDSMVGPANMLAGGLLTVTLFWRATLAMVNKTSMALVAFEVLLFGIIAVALINNYAMVVEQIWDIAMSALNAIGLSIGDTFADFLTAFFKPIGDISARWVLETQGKTWFSKVFDSATLDWIGSLLLIIVIIILAAMAVINVVGIFLMGPVFFAVGVVFGPMFIATIVSDYTRKWFDQWLNFMVGAAFLTAVAVAVMKLLTLTVGNAVTNLQGGSSTYAMLGVALLMSAASKLFGAVPSITDAIFPGRTGAGSAIPSGGSAKSAGPAAAGGLVGSAAGAAMSMAGLTQGSGSPGMKGAAARAFGGAANIATGMTNAAKRAGSQNPLATVGGMVGAAVKPGAKAAGGFVAEKAMKGAENAVSKLQK